MRINLLKTSKQLLLLIALIAGRTQAQDLFSLDWNVSLIRGSWEYHTFRDKWTLAFECDHKMFFDREPADYSLTAGSLRIQGSDGVVDYPYTLEAEQLSITLPDGTERTYRRTDPGEAEHLLHGTFYLLPGSSPPGEKVSFDGDRSFELQSPSSANTGGNVVRKGVYRVEGDVAVLAFGDSSVLETQVHARDDDGTVTSLMIADKLFASEEPSTATTPAPVQMPVASAPAPQPYVGEVLYGVPDLPQAISVGDPPPVGTGTPANPEKKDTKAKDAPRKFGTTRGKDDHR